MSQQERQSLEIHIQNSSRWERNTPVHSSLVPYLRGQNLDNIFMDTEHREQLQIITFLLIYQISRKNNKSLISTSLSVLGPLLSLFICFCRISGHVSSCTLSKLSHSNFYTLHFKLNRCICLKVWILKRILHIIVKVPKF